MPTMRLTFLLLALVCCSVVAYFGLLAVRMAKALSVAFGDGILTSADERIGEKANFGKPTKWMDYSGEQRGQREGITYFDHPSNPGHPTAWHVREDGWMGAAPCLAEPRLTTKANPLTLRYLLHAHRGLLHLGRAREVRHVRQPGDQGLNSGLRFDGVGRGKTAGIIP